MKKNKGFTLIELLAVIVVLVILLIIAVPKILNVIEEAERKAFKESAELMAHTARVQYDSKEVTGEAQTIPEEGLIYTYENNEQSNIDEVGELKFSGDKPLSGSITLTQNKKTIITELVSKNGKWCAVKAANEKEATVRKASELGCTVEESEPVIEDKKPCEMEEATIEGVKVHYIDSASDLYAFSQSVNAGTSYENEKIVVRNNLDMSTAEGTCVTTFDPIGTESNPFKGEFDGGFNTISNLTINKPNQDNVGLFGCENEADIKKVCVSNISVTGNNYVGGIIGKAKGGKLTTLKAIGINVTGKGTNALDIGGIIGASYSPGPLKFDEAEIDNVNVVTENGGGGINGHGNYNTQSTNILAKNVKISGKQYVYGVSNGYSYPNTIVENLTVEGTTSTKIYTHISDDTTYILNYNLTKNKGLDSETKSQYTGSKDIGDINFLESVGFDTYIGGDNNSTGYYFDYDSSGDIHLVKVNDKTFKLTMKKDSYDNYLITNEKDWKIATAHLSEKYKLTKDLDFSNKHYYMMGSAQNPFKGTIDGDMNQIKNVTINASKGKNIGLFGYENNANIEKINASNITIIGADYVGGIIGRACSGKLTTLKAIGISVTGKGTNALDIGGIIGASYSPGPLKFDEAEIDNVNVVTENGGGGINGHGNYNTQSTNILAKNVKISGKQYVYGVSNGYSYPNTIVENLTVEGTTSTKIYTRISDDTTYILSYNLTKNKESDSETTSNKTDTGYIDNLSYYSGKIETLYQGDANNTGYFFDYADDGKVRLVKAYTSTSSSTLNVDPSSTVTYTNPSCSEQTAPTCELKSMQILTNGFTPLVECTDDTQIESFRSYFDSRTSKVAETYEQIGNSKSNISWSNSNKTITYNGTWRETNKTGPWPRSGVCYYFRYGARDTCGNYSTYVSDSCFSY